MFDPFLLLLAGALGWCLARASLCAVAATQEAVLHRRATALYLQLIAVSLAGVSLLGASLVTGSPARLPGAGAPLLQLLAAAAVMAAGALLNGGCYLGSILYLGRGKANFLFCLVGIALAARFALPAHAGIAVPVSSAGLPDVALRLAAIAAFACCAGVAFRAALGACASGIDVRIVYTLVAGLLAGALMAHAPGWGYNVALGAIGRAGIDAFNVEAVLPACALFAGAVASCIAAGQWSPERPTLRGAARCLAGGFVLESAARCIPGGNDTLLFWVMPGLGGYGFVAYVVILSVLLLAWSIAARASRQAPAA
jgi:hypothetical protein